MSEKVTEINKPEDNEMKLKLSREYDFEGQKICEIDLSGLDNLTAADMIQANKVLTNNGTSRDNSGIRPHHRSRSFKDADRVL